MNEDAFNVEMLAYTEEFIKNWLRLVDDFSRSNELGPNHKLTLLLYSHLGIEKKISSTIWDLGVSFMDSVIKIAREG